MTNSNNYKKGVIARILGDQPTALQKTIFWLMVLSLVLWPSVFFASLFIFDAPIRSKVDEICRWGMTLTIWTYPIYLFPLMILWFKVSKCLRASWLFGLCPLIPVALFCMFVSIDSSAFAASKPKEYDSATYKRINETYATDVNHVYFCNEILKDADPATFRILDYTYVADKQHVWFNGDLVKGAHPTTFVAPDKSSSHSFVFSMDLAHDDHDYYWHTEPLHVADMRSFKKVGSSWAVDSRYIYYLGLDAEIGKNIVPIGDYHTFKALNDCYAADAKCVYYKNELVKGADPKSFKVLKSNKNYGQDKNRVYYQANRTSIRDFNSLKHKNMKNGLWNAFHTDGTTVYNPELKPMPVGTDFATIHIVERYRDWYADENRVYYENRLLLGAKPQTFKIFQSHDVSEDYVSNNNKSSYYSYDGNHIYYRDSLMYGVDIPSFICGYDYVDSCSFAFDKNRYYQGNPNLRLEKLRQGKYRVDN